MDYLSDAAQGFIDAFSKQPDDEKRTRAATVSYIDNEGTIWVRFIGADSDTPVVQSSATVNPGDFVEVVTENGRARIYGNVSNPSAQIDYADTINANALQALNDAQTASNAAVSAQRSADSAAGAAANAQQSADDAATAAGQAIADAATANANANQAIADAAAANTAAGNAQTSANQAASAASNAQTSANTANTAANNALSGLSTVQGVVEALGQDVDDLQTHVALTDEGLFITLNAAGYKLKLTNTGAYVIDGNGATVTTFSESITFSSTRPQYIGGEDAYIVFYDANDTGHPDTIRIGGNVILGGSKTLSEVLAEVQKSQDICTLSLTSTNGTVFKTDSGVSTTINVRIFTGDGSIIETQQALVARYGSAARLRWKWKDTGAQDFTVLLDDDPRLSRGGFSLTVSPTDISTQAVINCELIY